LFKKFSVSGFEEKYIKRLVQCNKYIVISEASRKYFVYCQKEDVAQFNKDIENIKKEIEQDKQQSAAVILQSHIRAY